MPCGWLHTEGALPSEPLDRRSTQISAKCQVPSHPFPSDGSIQSDAGWGFADKTGLAHGSFTYLGAAYIVRYGMLDEMLRHICKLELSRPQVEACHIVRQRRVGKEMLKLCLISVDLLVGKLQV